MIAAWFKDTALAFDLESTHPEPMDARMVTATCVEVDAKGIVAASEFLINPGVLIPAEATAIHGVTNEQAAKGRPMDESLSEILTIMEDCWARGLPLIAMNANYDLTVIDCEIRRQGGVGLTYGNILDPFVIDRGCDPYRKGKRTLAATCAHYGVKQEGAHSSSGDALAAARLIWRMARLAMKPGPFARLGKLSLDSMQQWQRQAHFDRQTNYEEYSRKNNRLGRDGKPEVVEKSWPIRGARELEETRDPADFRPEHTVPEPF